MKRCMFNKMVYIGIFLIFLNCTIVTNTEKNAKEGIEYLSPVSLVADRECIKLYIAESTGYKIAVFDLTAGRVSDIISLKDEPCGLALAPDGSKLYVTCGSSEGTIKIIDLNCCKAVETIPVGHTPCSPVISPDGKTLYVCNRFDNNVSVIDIALKKEIAKVPMMREPVVADITPDGKYLFVANHLPTATKIDEYVIDGGYMDIKGYSYKEQYAAKSVILIVDTESNRLEALIQLPIGSTGIRGICISPDGEYAYVTHILARYKLPAAQIERGSINTNALSIINVAELKLLNTVLLDDIDLGAANPWGVACSPEGDFICVTHAGTHEISVIDRPGLHAKLNKIMHGKTIPDASSAAEDVANNLAFLDGLRQRIQLTGNGPRGIVIAGTKVYVAEYFTDTLGMADINPGGKPEIRSVALGPIQPLTSARKGEMYFNDANLCFQKWHSCASCHPDGRHDALNWDLLNDGTGNPKNTRSLLLSHQTPPVMITGVRPRAEDAVRAGIKHILFKESPEEVADAIDTYLKSLKAVPSPYLAEGKLNKEAKRGKKIFKKSGCIKCHPASLYTDMKKYDAGTGSGKERNLKFDTPTLIEVWRTAPYLYDGRAKTIYDVLITYNIMDKHGITSQLNYSEINDLIEYILSL
ncbi:beta-propeller fold lactonase family protein [Candidatus Latescibacterota bacterium]